VTVAQHAQDISLADRLRRLVQFLAVFKAPAFEFGSWVKTEEGISVLPYAAYSPETKLFVQSAYKFGWVSPEFDWGDWMLTEEAAQLREHPEALSKATPDQLARLLTVLIRQDRFVEGALQSAFESGLLTRILERAASILAEVDPPEDASAYQGKDEEFFYEKDGKRQDAALHEPILSGDHGKAEAIGKKVARRLGLTSAAIERLYPRK